MAYGQGELSNWYFGAMQLLKFTGDSVHIVDNQNVTNYFYSNENNSCISDENGNFLFYSNGVALFNSNIDTMPNGGLTGNIETAQNVIIPRPNHPNRFYVFVPGRYYADAIIRYSEVDMALDSGLGDVVSGQHNVYLYNNVSQKVTAVHHANGIDIWVITHELYTNNFLSFLVTEEGVEHTPVISSVGSIHIDITPPAFLYDAACKGEIKISPYGRRLSIASKGLGIIELFDFDTETGFVSAPINISMNDPVNLEFSSDGNVAYASTDANYLPGWDTTKIFQINLLAGSVSNIVNSTTSIAFPPHINFFQGQSPLLLAYNDKIYFGCNSPFLPPNYGVLNSPHKLGGDSVGINYTEHTWYTTLSSVSEHGLPNFFRSYLDKNIFATTVCFGDTTMLWTKNSYLFDSIRWEISDPQTGLHTWSNVDTISHQYSQPGQ